MGGTLERAPGDDDRLETRVKVKVKQSPYRPAVAQRVPGS